MDKIKITLEPVDNNRLISLCGPLNTNIKEIIIATNLNLEGEATAMYLQKILSHENIKITRLARGLPSGSDIEYADQTTISHALNSRVDINENIE